MLKAMDIYRIETSEELVNEETMRDERIRTRSRMGLELKEDEPREADGIFLAPDTIKLRMKKDMKGVLARREA